MFNSIKDDNQIKVQAFNSIKLSLLFLNARHALELSWLVDFKDLTI